MVDNFEYGYFENLTLRLRHQTGLCWELSSPLSEYRGKGMSAPGRPREGDS